MVSSLAIPLSKPVDPASLIALGAIECRVEENVLYLTMPWTDPWSWRLLLRHLNKLETPRGYSEFAARRDAWLHGGLLDQQNSYWERELAGVPELSPAAQVYHYAFVTPPADYVAFLTAFLTVLACHTGETDLCVGIQAPNRHRPGTTDIVGPLANTLGIRVDAGLPDLARQVPRKLLDALRNQEWPQSRTFAAMFLPETVEGATWIAPRSSADLTLTADGFEYNPERYSPEAVASMAGHLQNLLRNGEMPGAAEKEKLALFNQTRKPYREKPIHQLIQPSETPAVSFEGRTLTYRELLLRAEALAAHLRQLGAGTGSLIGVLLERSEELPVAIVAIWMAGSAYLPLDPAFPAERINFMMSDSGARILITQRSLAGIAAAEYTVLTGSPLPVAPAHFRPPQVVVDDLACILYTSGSTGQPKGALISHRNLINLFDAVVAEIGFVSTDVMLAISTLTFDAAAMELFAPLTVGGRVEIASREVARDSRRLGRLIEESRATAIFATPATWRALVESGWQGIQGLKIISGGEVLKPDLAASLLVRCAAVWNGYGPTETTVFSAMYRVREDAQDSRIPIGRPIANTQFSVRDPNGALMPPGLAGELWIGGDGVSRGYLNRPELNSEKFTPEGEFRTGDRVRFRDDGNLEYLGRLDTRVKVRGNRVEAGEVEAAIVSCPGIREAAVIADSDSIAAYVAGRVPAAKLREHVALRLPDYMVPSRFIYVETMPLTASGKIDLLALPAQPALTPPGEERPFLAPRTPVEKVVASIFAEVLHVDRVASDDDFFLLGGHSLLATQVLSRVWEMWKVELPARVLFESPTVSELALRIAEVQTPKRAEPVRVRPANPPLSFAQQRLWFLDNLYETDRALYNIPMVVRLHGRFDIAAFARALNEVVRRHESLRTNFADRAGEPVQIISETRVIDVPLLDHGAALAETGKPFDLADGPLIRACAAQTAPDEYELIVVLHHIVSDGWSFGVLFNELNALLHARALLPLSIQYADFAQLERDTLTEAALAPRLEYWRKQLAGAPAVLELPADYARSTRQTFRGARHEFVFPKHLADALNRFCAAERVTPFMVLLTAFHILLRRYSGETDLSVGTPIANRTRVDTEKLIGFFVNTLVLRTRAAAGVTFRELLVAVRNTALDAFAHQDVPFQKLVEALQPDRALSHTPFFQVMFAVQNAESVLLDIPGVVTKGWRWVSDFAKYDLTVNIEDTQSALAGTIEYNRDLFEPARIERLAGHFGVLLSAAIAQPECDVDTLPLLTPQEQRIFAEWNETGGPYRRAAFPDLFAAQVARTPEATAVEFAGNRWTYAELDARANAVAGHLFKHGVALETPVGIMVERSLEMMAGMLGIWKAGGAYVPIDPDYPEDRQAFLREDSGVAMVLTRESIAALPGHAPVAIEAGPANLAYIIYTSGSTGKPKGVAIEHGSLANLLEGMRRQTGIGEGDAMLALATAAFDMSVPELWLPLTVGARVVIASRDDARDGARLHQLLAQSCTTIMQGTPTTWTMLLDEGWVPAPQFRLLCGAEALPNGVKDRLAALPCVSWNMFGPTETCVWSTAARIDAGPVTIGQPMLNTRVWVLDANAQPVPVGIPGELFIGGEGVARGYWKRPDLTAEKFVTGTKGERMYRTGDRVRWRADGRLEFVERLDSQVKLRGYRIELGEIETVLASCPGIRAAAVAIREAHSGEKRLTAYLAAEQISESELRQILAAQLPDYLVPSRFVRLDALPLSLNGKVDRRRLAALPESEEPERAMVTAPRTPNEEVIANIFAGVLGIENAGLDDNFFQLGGHSLLATRAVSRIREKLRVELALRTLFEAPTVRGLARRMESDQRGSSGPALKPYPRTGREPVSFGQQRLWFLDRFYEGKSPMYNIPHAIALAGPVDAGKLRAAFAAVVARHEDLRTTFRQVDGMPLQVFAPDAALDFAALGIEEGQLTARIDEEAGRAFDLTRGPLLRVRLYRISEQRHVLLIVMHHIVSDMWSFGILSRELGDACAGAALPPLPIQYADFTQWQREWLVGDRLESEASYWRRQLAGVPPLLDLPADAPRPAEQTFRAANAWFTLDKGQTGALKRFSRTEDVTLFMTLLAGFQAVLARYSGVNDISVGTPIANRTRMETEGLIGFFANTLVMRTDLNGEPTFRELLGRVREVTLDAYAHQELPFEKLVEILEPERSPSYTPLFQVFMVLQNVPGENVRLPGVAAEWLRVDIPTARFDVSLGIDERDGELHCQLNYNRDLFAADRMERMAGHFTTLLAGAVANPGTHVHALPLLTLTEQNRFHEWNATETSYPQQTFLDLFSAQAAKTPDALAAECETRRWTYAELDARSNAVAAHLRGLGVGPEVLVGIVVERSLQMIAGLLGIWKAGGAYVPLDPDQPEERQALIRNDSGVAIVLTSAGIAGLKNTNEAILPGVGLESLAYVMYTSGSTGVPKGVALQHGSIVNLLEAMRGATGIGASDVLAAITTAAFDISILELWMPLMVGARVILATREEARDAARLRRLITKSNATVMQGTPTTWAMLLESGWIPPPGFQILCGAEALPAHLAARLAKLDRVVWNLFGPTETCVWSTMARVDEGPVTIGRPIANTRVFVLDPYGSPVPAGVWGELYIGGAGVARGYWNRPELTAQKFVEVAGERVFRTGDNVRWRGDGQLEFSARLDTQVKLRGFRIELGEIEAALTEHPSVRAAAVMVREDVPGENSLAGYLVLEPGSFGALGAEQLAEWASIWDASYRRGQNAADATFNLAGWNSSYTGEPIPAEQMRAWVQNTVHRILALGKKRVWEIGCGTGLLLFRIAPHAEQYHGTDFSRPVIDFLNHELRRADPPLPGVSLACRPADMAGNTGAQFDLVVLNSVIQYFPDVDYLVAVLSGAMESLTTGGSIFIGDVRSLALLKAFHTSVQIHRAADSLSREQLAQRIEEEVRNEGELVVDPDFFTALQQRMPRISRVDVQLKRGDHHNELTCFRYDVVLHAAEGPPREIDLDWIDWQEIALTPQSVRELLQAGQPEFLALTNVPNGRLTNTVAAMRMLDDGGVSVPHAAQPPVDPEALWQIEKELPYRVEIRPSSAIADGTCDVVLRHTGTPENLVPRYRGAFDPARPLSSYANNPLKRKSELAAAGQLRDLRAALSRKLPDYMIPSRFVVLDALPLSANGKTDRRALPPPDDTRSLARTEAGVSPQDDLERTLLKIWKSVLKDDSISVTDNFFSLGGHSLQAVKLVAKMEEETGMKVPLFTLFSAPTVRQIAAILRKTPDSRTHAGLVPIQPLGSQRPFFMLEARPMFHQFAQLLGTDQPLLGVPWPDLPELEKPYNIPQIASLLVERLRARQPHGPYIIGGWCIATTVAYEMAQQLTAQGETVEMLVFFDGANVAKDPTRTALARCQEKTQLYYSATIYSLKRIRRMGAREGAVFAGGRMVTVFRQAKLLVLRGISKVLGLRGRALGEPGNLRDIDRAVLIAAFDYRPKPYPGRVVYFKRGLMPKLKGNGATFWWGSLLPRGLEIYETGGRHSEMFHSPNVEAMAAKLRDLLADARAGQNAPAAEEPARATAS